MRFQSILIVLTEQCHVGCQHCGYLGSTREGEMTISEIVTWTDQVVKYGIPEVIFTGGEAFERFDLLAAGVAAAAASKIRASVFTSSFWASSIEMVEAKLTALQGLTQLYLSTDVYHQRRVPYAFVRNVIDVALQRSIKVSLNITYATEEDRLSVLAEYERYGKTLQVHCDRVIPNSLISPRLLAKQDACKSFDATHFSHWCWLSTPLIGPQGEVFACHIGKIAAHTRPEDLPYYLGDLRENDLCRIFELMEERADYQFMRTHGPRGVAEMALNKGSAFPVVLTSSFTNACDMCKAVLTTPGAQAQLEDHARSKHFEVAARRALVLGESPPPKA